MKNQIKDVRALCYSVVAAVPLLMLTSGPASAAICGGAAGTADPFAPPPPPGGSSEPAQDASGPPTLIGMDVIQSSGNISAGGTVTERLPDVCEFASDADNDDIVWRLAGESGTSVSVDGLTVSLSADGTDQALTLVANSDVAAGIRQIELVVAETGNASMRSGVVSFSIQVESAPGDGDEGADDDNGSDAGGEGTDGGEGANDGDSPFDDSDPMVPPEPPGIPANVTAERLANGRVQVSWIPADGGEAVKGYNVYRDGSYLLTVFDVSFVDSDVATDATARYRIGAVNDIGDISALSQVATVGPVGNATDGSRNDGGDSDDMAPDTDADTDTDTDTDTDSDEATDGDTAEGVDPPPAVEFDGDLVSSLATVPTALAVSDSASGSIMITWTGGGEDTRGFNVYRNGLYLETVFETRYTDFSVVDGVLYQYAVAAFDFDNLSTVRSLPVNAVASNIDGDSGTDRVRPSAPLDVVARRLSTGDIIVAWHPGDDDVGVVGFNIYRNRQYYATSLTQVFVDDQPPESGGAVYQVVAFDEARNFSVASVASELSDVDVDVDAALSGVTSDEGAGGEQSLYLLNLSASRLVVFANGQQVGIWPDSLGASARRVSVPSGMLTVQVFALGANASSDTVATLQIQTGMVADSTLLIDDSLLGR